MNNDGINVRKCDQDGCIMPATHTLVWDEHKYYCLIHVNKALGIAQAMGFPTPGRTVRQLTIAEMLIDDDGGEIE
jgi:hypothetical protein